MGIIRQDRIGQETTTSIKEIEEYINTNYLYPIQQRLEQLQIQRDLITEKLAVYNSINNENNNLINNIKTDSKYITVINNQLNASTLLNELEGILSELYTLINYKDIITKTNLSYKQDQGDNNKVNQVDGIFQTLQVPTIKDLNRVINKQVLIDETNKIVKPPLPLQPLKHLCTDEQGALIWK